jgi:hypothetical protein
MAAGLTHVLELQKDGDLRCLPACHLNNDLPILKMPTVGLRWALMAAGRLTHDDLALTDDDHLILGVLDLTGVDLQTLEVVAMVLLLAICLRHLVPMVIFVPDRDAPDLLMDRQMDHRGQWVIESLCQADLHHLLLLKILRETPCRVAVGSPRMR